MKLTKTTFVLMVCLSLATLPFGSKTFAAMISTDTAVSALVRTEQRAAVETFMQRQDVKAQFESLGVNASEASLRVAGMSDAEIEKIAGQIQQTPAGADVIVISLTTVLLVVIILLLMHKI